MPSTPTEADGGHGFDSGWQAGAETVWLPTSEEMSALDAHAASSGATTERALIEVAGREVARRVQARWPEGRVVAVAGQGHNGGDALVAVRTLQAWGREVAAVQAGSAAPEPAVLIGSGIELRPVEDLPVVAAGARALIDGVLGTGLSGPPRHPQAEVIRTINGLGVPICAVDGPSGADLSTGAVEGACIQATLTVALGWPKLGLLRYPARRYCGDIEAVEIGFPPPNRPMGARAITGRWVARRLEPRDGDAHKGRAGYLALVAGQSGMAGAAVLAARAALRGGVGILRVVSDPANREILQRSVPGAVFVGWDDEDAVAEAVRWAGAVAIGPGLGRSAERLRLVDYVLADREGQTAVVDADGLSVWEERIPELQTRLTERDLVTPHPGELARLLGRSPAAIAEAAPESAREATRILGCTVLLKGAPSLVAAGSEPLRVSTVGGAALAPGGTGDVLTGLIGAYLAAGMTAPDAAMTAMLVSGLAAEASPEPVGHIAADLPDRFPTVRARVMSLGPPAGPVVFASYAPGSTPASGDR